MHLTARRDPGNPLPRSFDFFHHTPDTEDRTLPPGPRALLRPSEPRHDLIVFLRGIGQDCSILRNDRRPHTTSADIDREEEIVLHGSGANSAKRQSNNTELNTPFKPRGERIFYLSVEARRFEVPRLKVKDYFTQGRRGWRSKDRLLCQVRA